MADGGGLAEERLRVVSKEEQLIFYDRPAKDPAEIVVTLSRPLDAIQIVRPAIRIQAAPAQVLEQAAMEVIGAGLQNHVHHSAQIVAKICGSVSGD